MPLQKYTYDTFNREERAMCSHLFRLLHENVHLKEKSPLGKFISLLNYNDLNYTNVAIYTEVALIRDYYFQIKDDIVKTEDFINKVIQIINLKYPSDYKSVDDLKKVLKNNALPHPSRIILSLKDDSNKKLDFFKALQGVFNAKPDIAITIDNILLVGEAKLTEPFSQNQLDLTNIIAKIWTELLYISLGFNEPPGYIVFKLGKTNTKRTKIKSDISWLDIFKIAEETYPKNDRSLIAIKAGTELF